MTCYCPECDSELVDENQGVGGLRFDYPHFVCPFCECEVDADGNCPECTEAMENDLTTVLGEEPYQEDEE